MRKTGKVLAIDYGGKRTGLAICDAMGIVANPLPAIVSTSLEETVNAIANLATERGVQTILCGMPFLPDGSEGGQVEKVRFFLGALRKRIGEGIPFAEIDERHTTKEAESMWRQVGFSRKKAKEFLDSTAAVVMLREFLELG